MAPRTVEPVLFLLPPEVAPEALADDLFAVLLLPCSSSSSVAFLLRPPSVDFFASEGEFPSSAPGVSADPPPLPPGGLGLLSPEAEGGERPKR